MFYIVNGLRENIVCIYMDTQSTCSILLQKYMEKSNQYMHNYMVIDTSKMLPILVINLYRKARNYLNN